MRGQITALLTAQTSMHLHAYLGWFAIILTCGLTYVSKI